jgi:preprotein translocase subunit SecE
VARNRKRAKERRARRPQPVASARAERDETPAPIAHGTPDVELAEAQLALGRAEPSEDDRTDDARDVIGDASVGEDAAEGVTDEDLADDAGESDELEELGPAAPRSAPIPGVGGVSPRVERGSAGGASVGDAALPATRALPGNRLVNFLRGSWNELQRVQWPDRRQVMQATGVVIGFVIVAGVFLGVADFLAGKIVDYILK